MAREHFEDVEVGQQLAPCPIPITTTRIVATAIASRDYQDVHHDVELAKKRGSPNIFMNILTTNGLVGRYVTDWAGPNALIRNVKLKLGTPNSPGDTMIFNGSVTAKDSDEVTIDLAGKNSWGDHVTASVRVALPE